MQNTVRMVDVLPNLPSELEVVILRPSDRVVQSDPRYQRQFRADFWVRKGAVLRWLQFLKANHPDYEDVAISLTRVDALPVDADVSGSFTVVIDDTGADLGPEPPVTDDLLPPNTQSMVPNLNITQTEVELIIEGVTGQAIPPLGVRAPSIRLTPIDEAAGKDRLFTMAFPTLYPTGRADYNAPRLRKVHLNDYAQHLIRFHDGRFGRHPRWRYLAFNMIMRRRANSSARFYVSKAPRLKEMSREELTDALSTDEGLLSHIVRQGSLLSGTRPFWRNKSNSLQAIVFCLSLKAFEPC
jgi:Helitron helicase-like domain at N-terminus